MISPILATLIPLASPNLSLPLRELPIACVIYESAIILTRITKSNGKDYGEFMICLRNASMEKIIIRELPLNMKRKAPQIWPVKGAPIP